MDPAKLNDFGFSDDPYGYKCPVGAHVRRANPRDMLLANKTDSITTVKRHRVMRRGRPYGRRIADRFTPDGQSRGLGFAALNANVERQFEFIQSAWISSPNFAGLYDEADPMLGGRTQRCRSIHHAEVPRTRSPDGHPDEGPDKGRSLSFMPGLAALLYLARLRQGD